MIAWNNTTGYKGWELSNFVEWHKGLVSHFGNEKTADGKYFKRDAIWVVFWIASEGMLHPKLNAILAVPSVYKKELEYFKKNAPDIYNNAGFKNAFELGKYNPIDKSAQIVKGAGSVIEGRGSALESAGKIIKIAVPLAL